MRAVLLLLAVILLGGSAAQAQARLSGPAPSILFNHARSDPRLQEPWVADTNVPTSHPTHWKEGALIGGILGAIGGALLGNAFCGAGDDTTSNCVAATVAGALGGAVLLGFPGALIGGAFPKHEED
jgi:tetrahydromethanopterin S-methyltransferase subunit D